MGKAAASGLAGSCSKSKARSALKGAARKRAKHFQNIGEVNYFTGLFPLPQIDLASLCNSALVRQKQPQQETNIHRLG